MITAQCVAGADAEIDHAPRLLPRLWVYTNYDCNLSCSYCVANSSPQAERRGLTLSAVRQVVDEAVALGIIELFLTGGEPLLLPDLYAMLEYAAHRLETTVLTNATLLRGRRLALLRAMLARLDAPAFARLTFQVSLDSASPGPNDAYRGKGSWQKALEGITTLRELGVNLKIGTTRAEQSDEEMQALEDLIRELGLSPEAHVVRPLVRRGFSDHGKAIALPSLLPELTINRDGVYWHPVATDEDLLLSSRIFPLQEAVETAQELLDSIYAVAGALPEPFA